MHCYWRLIPIIILLTGCNPSNNPKQIREKVPVDKNLRVVIKNGLSDKVDLMKGVYTVFFIGKPPVEVKFELTSAEKAQIINKYYFLALYELKEVNALSKNCSLHLRLESSNGISLLFLLHPFFPPF